MLTCLSYFLLGPGSLSEMQYFGNAYYRSRVEKRFNRLIVPCLVIDVVIVWFVLKDLA